MDILGLIALAKSSKGGNTSLFRFKGTVSTVNQLPIVGQNYDVYHVNENGYEYVWIDTYWEPLGNIVDMSAYRTAAEQDLIDNAQTATIPNAGNVGNTGVMNFKHGSDQLFGVQLPLWDGSSSGGQSGAAYVSDVQIDGTSIVQGGVAEIPIVHSSDVWTLGLVRPQPEYGIGANANGDGGLRVASAEDSLIKRGTGAGSLYKPIVPYTQHMSSFYGLAKSAGDTTQAQSANAVGQYTDNAKSAISEMLNGPVTVTGTTPTITALPGVRYVCGEVTTLDITLPASGIIDVTFESGSTATVLTITPPTGVTLAWVNGFDQTALEADTTYEINIMDGIGVAVGVSA